jgi:phospholipase/carboxylesterase
MALEKIIRHPSQQGSDTPPLLIMLHGYGSNEQDLFSFAPELAPELRIISFRAPYSLGMGSYAWYAINFDADQNKFSDLDQARESLTVLKEEIESLQAEYGNTAANTFILGFSQGCILSLAFVLNYPNKTHNIIGLSGYLMRELAPENLKTEDYNHVKIYNSHGTMDQVIPISWAQKTEAFMQDLAIDYCFEEYPAGHGVNPQNFFSLRNWINDKIK